MGLQGVWGFRFGSLRRRRRLAAATASVLIHADTLVAASWAAQSTRARSASVNRTGTGAVRRLSAGIGGLPGDGMEPY